VNPAYEHSVIGSMADLSAADVSDVAAFFKTYYAPNNAILSLVGDFKAAEALARVRKYFESIPAQPPPAPADMTEPPQTAERRQTIADPLAKLARVDIAWHTPPALAPDDDALTVLATILSGGRSSRFYDSLVRQQQLSPGVSASAAGTRGPGLFQVGGLALPGKTIAELERAIYAEIEKVKTAPVAAWELDKARNIWRRSYIFGLTSTLQRAISLGDYAQSVDDPNLINTYADRIAKVQPGDIQRVARQYLVETSRTVVITNPGTAAPPAAGGGPR
jgi:predicted Zn-dependent peptidase